MADDLTAELHKARVAAGGRAMTKSPYMSFDEVSSKYNDYTPLIKDIRKKYGKLIDTAASEHGVDPLLLAAVIAAESRGDPKAGSPAGAQGLMQLMSPTAKEMGVTDRSDPQQNINGGARYLAKLQKNFDTPEMVLTAYNWGWGNARQFSAGKRKLPRETREYVPLVLALTGTEGYGPGGAPSSAPPAEQASLNIDTDLGIQFDDPNEGTSIGAREEVEMDELIRRLHPRTEVQSE
jgi:hypothetical protein